MTHTRLDLHYELESIEGVREAYFQPPPSLKLVYPCIVYQRDEAWVRHADNWPYHEYEQYSVTVIDPDPETDIPQKLRHKFQMCRPGRPYTANNLNHYPHSLFY